MANNRNDISISAEIKIDKSGFAKDILNTVGSAQSIIDKNTLLVTLTGDSSDIERQIDELSQYAKKKDVNVLVRAETDLFKKDLAFIESMSEKTSKEIGMAFKNNLYCEIKNSRTNLSLDDLVTAKFGKTGINNVKKYLSDMQSELKNFKITDENFIDIKGIANKFQTLSNLKKEIENYNFGTTGLNKNKFDINVYEKYLNDFYDSIGNTIKDNPSKFINELERNIDFSLNKLEQIVYNKFGNIKIKDVGIKGIFDGTSKKINSELQDLINITQESLDKETTIINDKIKEIESLTNKQRELKRDFINTISDYSEIVNKYRSVNGSKFQNELDKQKSKLVDMYAVMLKSGYTSSGLNKGLKQSGFEDDGIYEISDKAKDVTDFSKYGDKYNDLNNIVKPMGNAKNELLEAQNNAVGLESELKRLKTLYLNEKFGFDISFLIESITSESKELIANFKSDFNTAFEQINFDRLIEKINEVKESTSGIKIDIDKDFFDNHLKEIKDILRDGIEIKSPIKLDIPQEETSEAASKIADIGENASNKIRNNISNAISDGVKDGVKDGIRNGVKEVEIIDIPDSVIDEILGADDIVPNSEPKTKTKTKVKVEAKEGEVLVNIEPNPNSIGNNLINKVQESVDNNPVIIEIQTKNDIDNKNIGSTVEKIKDQYDLLEKTDYSKFKFGSKNYFNELINVSSSINNLYADGKNNSAEYVNELSKLIDLIRIYKQELSDTNDIKSSEVSSSKMLSSKINDGTLDFGRLSKKDKEILKAEVPNAIQTLNTSDFFKLNKAGRSPSKYLSTDSINHTVNDLEKISNDLEAVVTNINSINTKVSEAYNNIESEIINGSEKIYSAINKNYNSSNEKIFSSLENQFKEVSNKIKEHLNNIEKYCNELNIDFSNQNKPIKEFEELIDNLSSKILEIKNQIETNINSINIDFSKQIDEINKFKDDNIDSIIDKSLNVKNEVENNINNINIDFSSPEKSIDNFKKKTNEIVKATSGIKEKVKENLDIDNIDYNFKSEKKAIDGLIEAINKVPKSIDKKNSAFTKERKHVEDEIQKEISSLKTLIDWISKVEKTINKVSTSDIKLNINVPNFKNMSKNINGNTLNSITNNLEKFANKINGIKIKNTSFFNNIKKLVEDGEKLKNLASVLSDSENKVKSVSNIVNNDGKQHSIQDSYKIIKQNMNAILELTRKQGNSTDINDELIKSQIESYKSKIKDERELIGKNINAVYENEIDLIRDKIELQTKNNESLKQSMISQSEEIELTIAEWEKATSVMEAYKEEIGEVQKIIRSSRRGNDGSELISYNVTDILGDTRTFGSNGSLLNTKTAVIDSDKIEKIQNKVIESTKKYYDTLSKIAKQNATDSLVNPKLIDDLKVYFKKINDSKHLLDTAKDRGYDVSEAESNIASEKQAQLKHLNYVKQQIKDDNRDKIEYKIDTKQFDADVSNIKTQLSQLDKFQEKYKQDIISNNLVLENSIKTLKDEKSSIEDKVRAQDAYNKALATQKNIISQMKNDKKAKDATSIIDNNIDEKYKNDSFIVPRITSNDINNYKEDLEKLGTTSDEVDTEISNLNSIINNINGESFNNKSIVKYTENLMLLGKESEEVSKLIQSVNDNLEIVGNDDIGLIEKAKAFNNIISNFKNAETQVNEIKEKEKIFKGTENAKDKKISKIDENEANGKYTTDLSKYISDVKRLTTTYDEASEKANELTKLIYTMVDTSRSVDERLEAERKYQNELDRTKQKIKELNNSGGSKSTKNETDKAISNYEELTKKLNKYYQLLDKKNSVKVLTANQQNEFDELSKSIDNAINKVEEFSLKSSSVLDIDNYNNAFKNFYESNEKAKNNTSNLWIDNTKNTIKQLLVDSSNKDSEYSKKLNDAFAKLNKDYDGDKNPYKLEVGVSQEEISKIIEARKEIESTINYVKNNKNYNLADTLNVDKAITKITEWKSLNTKAIKDYGSSIDELINKLKNGKNTMSVSDLNNILSSFEKIKTEVSSTGKNGLSFFDEWKTRMGSLASYLSSYVGFYEVFDAIRSGISVVKELDTAFVEMQKVSNDSEESLKRFAKASFDVADKVGTTSVNIQNSVADWMRLGESLNEATKSAEASNILLNVSEFESIESATESLVAMSQAYKDLDKMEIVDILNNIGNNFSISTDGLATALQDSASALLTAGNDLNESVALITAGNAITQDANSVGAGMRTIALRLTGTEVAKDQLEELGEETDGVVTTVSKLRDIILSATAVSSNGFKGFDILDDNGNYKGTYESLQGIADIYEEIVETDKKTGNNNINLLLETLAGKNRANIAASILQNPEMLREAYKSALNDSNGSANKELDKYLGSIDGKTEKLQNRLQELASTIINEDSYKFLLDIANGLLEAVIEISNHLPLISASIISIIASYKGISLGGILNNATEIFNTITNGSKNVIDSIKEIKDIYNEDIFKSGNLSELFKSDGSIQKSLKDKLESATFNSNGDIVNSNNINDFINISSTNINNVLDKLNQVSKVSKDTGQNITDLIKDIDDFGEGGSIALNNFVNGFEETEWNSSNLLTSVNETKDGIKLMGDAAQNSASSLKLLQIGSSLLQGALIGLISYGIGEAIQFIYELSNSSERFAEQSKTISDEFNSAKESIEDYKEEIVELYEVINSGTSSYEESKNARERLLDIQDEMIEKYGNEEKAIKNITYAIQGEVESLENLQELEWQKKLNEFNDASVKDKIAVGFESLKASSEYNIKNKSDVMAYEMENQSPTININTVDYYKNLDKYDKLIESIRDKYGEDSITDPHIGTILQQDMSILGTANEVENILLDMQSMSKELGLDGSEFQNSLSKEANSVQNTIDKYGELYKEYEIREVLLNKSNKTGIDSYKKLTDAYKQYENAVTDEEITSALENYQQVLSDIETTPDFEGKEFLTKELFPEMQSVADNWQLKLEAQAKIDDENAKKELENFKNVVNKDILSDFNIELSDEALTDLSTKLKKEGISLDLDADVSKIKDRISKELKDINPLSDVYNDYSSINKKASNLEVSSKQSVYGNLNINEQPMIQWDESSIERYKTALLSWNDEYKNIMKNNGEQSADLYWKEFKQKMVGTCSSIESSMGNFEGVNIAFTPILKTDDGTIQYLSKDTVSAYLSDIVELARGTDGNIELSDIIKLDASGFEVDGIVIKNIISGIGDEAFVANEKLKYLGKDGYLVNSLSDIKLAAENAGMSFQEFINSCEAHEIVYSQEAVENAIQNVIEKLQEEAEQASYVSELFSNETLNLSEQISSLQSSIQSVNDALIKVNTNSLTSEDVVTLLSQFPELINYINVSQQGFGNLKEGLEAVKQARMTSLIESLRQTQTSTEAEAEALDKVCNMLDKMCNYTPSNNFDNMINNLNAVENSVSNAVNAMKTLEEGTALTKAELVDLAFQYPELLKQSNLFTDGSVEGQKNMINSIIDMSEQQYDSIIDEQIAELEAKKSLIQAQVEVEEQKQAIALQMSKDLSEGKITNEAELAEGLNKLNELESQNYVELVDGEVAVSDEKVNALMGTNQQEAENYASTLNAERQANADTLNQIAEDTDNNGSAIHSIMNKVANSIMNGFGKGGESGSSALAKSVNHIINNVLPKLTSPLKTVWINIKNALSGSGDVSSVGGGGSTGASGTTSKSSLTDYVKGGWEKIKDFGKNFASSVSSYLNQNSSSHDALSSNYNGLTINGKSAKDWINDYSKTSKDYTSLLNKAIGDINTQIANLSDMKGLKLADVTSSSGSGSGSGNKGSGGSGNKGSGNKGNSKDKSDEEDTSKSYDLIAIAIERVESKIQKLDKLASATYKKWSSRNSNLKSEITQISNEIALQSSSYSAYMKAADSVGLGSKYKKMIQNGGTGIFTTSDEKLQEKFEQYQQYWEAAQDCLAKITDLESDLASKFKAKFDNISSEYDQINAGFKHSSTMINTYITEAENKGYLASNKYYEALKQIENNNLNKLKSEKNSLVDALDDAVKNGNIQKYSQDWYDMCNQIDSVTEAIEESNSALIEYAKTIRENNWSLFDKKNTYTSYLTSESDFLIDLLGRKDSYDDNGNITKEGIAINGLHAVKYNTYMKQADAYAKEIASIEDEISKNPYNTELLERKQELLSTQRELILSAEDEKQSLLDLTKNAYDKLLESIQKVIDKKKEQLQLEKDLYDYQKQIAEKTQNLSTLEKQMNAYANDDSEESKATIQKLKVSLEDARKDLEQTEYDKYISDQQNMMDNMYSELEEHLNLIAEDIKIVISQVVEATNSNAQMIAETISSDVSEVGYTLTQEMADIWSDTSNTEGIENIVSTYSENFDKAMTKVNDTIEGIKKNLDEAQKKANEEATKKANASTTSSKSGTSTVKIKDDSKKTTAAKSTSTTKSSSANSKSTTSKTSTTTSTTSKSNTNNNSSGKWDSSIFTKKKSSYNKNKLRKDVSIVDRLKYFDFASSYSYRKKYYAAMGGSGTYKGSSSQNAWMIKEMKSHGFKKGGTIGDIINKTGEDGFVLARTGEEILSLEKIKQLRDVLSMTNDIFNGISSINTPTNDYVNHTKDSITNCENLNVEFNLPNVTNYEDFVNKAQSDKRFEKIIQQMALGNAMKTNSLTKYKF